MILALLFVVFVIFAIAWVAKRFNLAPTSSSHLKMISNSSLGGRERIVIIEIQGEQHAIGVTPQSVNHLFKLEKNIETAKVQLTGNTLVHRINKLFGYQAPETSQSKDISQSTNTNRAAPNTKD